jgi:methionine biosynthesis protein MetW
MGVTEHNKKIYSALFSDDKRRKDHYKLFESKNRLILSMINNNPKEVLEVGCGDGWILEGIKKKFGAEVYGIDISPEALKIASKRGVKTKEFNLDGKRWPYAKKKFDVVVASDVIEHLYDTEKFVQEAHSVLKEDGIFLVSIPNINCYYNRLFVLFGKMPLWIEAAREMVFTPMSDSLGNSRYNTGHIRVFNKSSISKLLSSFGFKISDIKGFPFQLVRDEFPEKMKSLVPIGQKIENLFSRSPRTSSFILVKAVKK